MAEGPGADQVPSQAGDQPAGPSSERPHRHGAAPGKGNTPARTPLTPYKRWYNSNRPGKRERAAGETSRGIPLPENLRLEKGDLKGKGKPKGKDKGKGKGPESKGKEAGKEQGGKGLGKTPPPPPPAKKRPLVTEPGPVLRQGRSQTRSTLTTRSRTLSPRPRPVKPALVPNSCS